MHVLFIMQSKSAKGAKKPKDKSFLILEDNGGVSPKARPAASPRGEPLAPRSENLAPAANTRRKMQDDGAKNSKKSKSEDTSVRYVISML